MYILNDEVEFLYGSVFTTNFILFDFCSIFGIKIFSKFKTFLFVSETNNCEVAFLAMASSAIIPLSVKSFGIFVFCDTKDKSC